VLLHYLAKHGIAFFSLKYFITALPDFSHSLLDFLLGEEAEASPSIANTLWRV